MKDTQQKSQFYKTTLIEAMPLIPRVSSSPSWGSSKPETEAATAFVLAVLSPFQADTFSVPKTIYKSSEHETIGFHSLSHLSLSLSLTLALCLIVLLSLAETVVAKHLAHAQVGDQQWRSARCRTAACHALRAGGDARGIRRSHVGHNEVSLGLLLCFFLPLLLLIMRPFSLSN